MTDLGQEPITVAPARIGIVEDDDHLRDYLCDIVDASPGLKVAFAVGTIGAAMRQSETCPIDLCLVDLQLPDGNGADLVRHLKGKGDAKCLILTVLGDRTSVMAALDSGADGYLLKDTPPATLAGNIISTLEGYAPISPRAAHFLLDLYQRDAAKKISLGGGQDLLSSREQEVLKLFSRGLSYREAAEVMRISEHTIRDHVKSTYRKLSVHSRSEAVFEARQLGIISSLD